MKRRIISFLLFIAIIFSFSGCAATDFTLYFGIDTIPENLDPQKAESYSELITVKNCFRGLLRLDENNIPFEERPIKEQNPSYEELKVWYQMSGMPLKKFFNTSGLLYKDMGLKVKLSQMSEEEQLQLLATNGMLVKRPLVVGEDYVLTGFKEKEWEEKILK